MRAQVPAVPRQALGVDDATAVLVEEKMSLLIKRCADILLAVILFGSIARHEEHPHDVCPSDVDLLATFETTDRLIRPYREDIFASIIYAYALHLDVSYENNVLPSNRTMQTWDSMFLDKLARDGIMLYVRGSLPTPLAVR
jgi:predicted nucleotidyltransferase